MGVNRNEFYVYDIGHLFCSFCDGVRFFQWCFVLGDSVFSVRIVFWIVLLFKLFSAFVSLSLLVGWLCDYFSRLDSLIEFSVKLSVKASNAKVGIPICLWARS